MKKVPKTPLHLVEGINGTWHYHLSVTGKNGQPALCGNPNVMCSEAPLRSDYAKD